MSHSEVCWYFQKFFVNIGDTFKTEKDKPFLVETNKVVDTLKEFEQYSAHPSVPKNTGDDEKDRVLFSKCHLLTNLEWN